MLCVARCSALVVSDIAVEAPTVAVADPVPATDAIPSVGKKRRPWSVALDMAVCGPEDSPEDRSMAEEVGETAKGLWVLGRLSALCSPASMGFSWIILYSSSGDVLVFAEAVAREWSACGFMRCACSAILR